MFEPDNEEKMRVWLKKVCVQVEAPIAFRESLKQEISHNQAEATTCPALVLGLSPATWALINALIAITLIAYGLNAIPSPSVVINSIPQPLPQNVLPIPPV